MTTKEALLYQNARFYEALEHSNLEMMKEIWFDSPAVRCIHPGWEILEGREAVLESWTRIFGGDVTMHVTLRNVRADVYGSMGIVVLVEEIHYSRGKLSNTGTVMATNVFRHDGRDWKMIHHHGSPVLAAGDQEGENYRFN
jgi:hypothetical protein